jgi:Bacteriocin-protection, YdeI or OmpD-Associated/Domain of unknown function (DUF1905)
MRFDGEVEQRDRGFVVRLPFDPKEAFGRVRAPVVVTVDDRSFCTTTMRYGDVDLIGLNREVRDATGLTAGDRATFELAADTRPREVDVPEALAAALHDDAAARVAFDALSYTHRREYARWIDEAKREETRQRRVARAVELLRDGVRTPDSALAPAPARARARARP